MLDAAAKMVGSGQVGQETSTVSARLYAIVIHAGDNSITVSDVQVVCNKFTKVQLKKRGRTL
jgi:hypothetical protein